MQDLTAGDGFNPRNAGRRETLLQAVDGLAKRVEGNDQIATYDEFHARAREMVLSSEARRAFAIEREPEKLRDRYGRNTAGQSMLLARRLVESGVRFVTVNYGGWDHHAKIFEASTRSCRSSTARSRRWSRTWTRAACSTTRCWS